MNNSIENKQNNDANIEDIIFNDIVSFEGINLKNIPEKELQNLIREKIEKANYINEDWQMDYAVERIVSKIEKKINSVNHPKRVSSKNLGWFNFYVYIRLPLSVILGILNLLVLIDLHSNVIWIVVSVLQIVISGVLFWGLKKRKLWAWEMNFFVLIFETIILALSKLDVTMFIITIILFGLIWVLPNWIYFNNRKFLFH